MLSGVFDACFSNNCRIVLSSGYLAAVLLNSYCILFLSVSFSISILLDPLIMSVMLISVIIEGFYTRKTEKAKEEISEL